MKWKPLTTENSDNQGSSYLARAADGAWRLHSEATAVPTQVRALCELASYPALLTPRGNLFRLGCSLRQLVRLKTN